MKNPATMPIMFQFVLTSLLLLATFHCLADNVNIAVASNFTRTLNVLAKDFETKTGHQTLISSASTGKLYTQIKHGAPFDIFLAADEARPEQLIAEGNAIAGTSFTYAIGKLVLLSNITPEGECRDILTSKTLERLAIANPLTAPYGAAARQVLKNTGLWQGIESRLVTGENISQVLQFVASGSATAGFVAKSSLLYNSGINSGCTWDVPAELHDPIRQNMVLLKQANNTKAAKEFWNYMQSKPAMQLIKNSGYDVLTPEELL